VLTRPLGLLAVCSWVPGKPSIDHAHGIQTGATTIVSEQAIGRRRPRHRAQASQRRLTEQAFRRHWSASTSLDRLMS
jgi:hypothetical protein